MGHHTERLAQDDRIEINQPSRKMQIKLVRGLPNGNDFVAYIDAIGKLDGNHCLLEWKTTTSRYPEEPNGRAHFRHIRERDYFDARMVLRNTATSRGYH